MMALGAIRAAPTRACACPTTSSVVGFDDIQLRRPRPAPAHDAAPGQGAARRRGRRP
jgi:hypothetical protein